MHRAERLGDGEQHHQTLDLAPAAEVDDVAAIAAGIGARRRFAARCLSEAPNQLRRVDHFVPIAQIGIDVHSNSNATASPLPVPA